MYIITYINPGSNHSHSIVKQLPQMVNKRILYLSCDKPKFLSKCIIYKVKVEANNNKITYYGASEGEFKSRYNHSKYLRKRRHENESEVSKYTWKLKDSNTN